MTLIVQRIANIPELESLASEWEEIDRYSSPRTPFTSPAWNLLWWQHFRENRFWVRDELFVLAVRDEHRRLIALAPLMRTLRPAWGPLRMRQIQFFGADANITELRGLVCRPEHRAEAMQLLHTYLMEQAGTWDSMLWCGISASEPADVLGAPAPSRTTSDYYLRLPGSWAELAAGLSRNMKEALRKCYNSLKRGGHAFTFRVVSKPGEVGAALRVFFSLHRARAELGGTVPHSNSFQTIRSRRFLRKYAQEMAKRDQLRVFQLIIDGKVVATRIGFILGQEVYFYYSGYSPKWRDFSVMTTLLAESIKWAIEQRFQIVNLSTGSDYSKARWQPEEVASSDYLIQSPMVQTWFVHSKLLNRLRQVPPRSLLGRVLAIVQRGR
jgi:CelD/BcsL family acetyltransferase involved in cellulose biosynthesis